MCLSIYVCTAEPYKTSKSNTDKTKDARLCIFIDFHTHSIANDGVLFISSLMTRIDLFWDFYSDKFLKQAHEVVFEIAYSKTY